MKLRNLDVFERIYRSHWFLSSFNGPGFIYDFPRMGGGKFITQAIYVMENEMCRYIFDRNEFDVAAHFTANRLINDHRWRLRIYKKIDYYNKKYFLAGEKLRKLQLALLSNTKIIKIIKNIIALQRYQQVYGILANGVILDGRNHLSNKIREELQSLLNYPDNFDEYWSMLTLVPVMSLRQRKDYQIALLAKQLNHLSKKWVEEKLKKIHGRYCWLDYNNLGPETSFEQFEGELFQAQKHNSNLNLPEHLRNLRQKQKRLMDKLKLDRRGRYLVGLAQHVIWQKGYRKDMQYHGFYCYESLFRELTRRKGISQWQTLTFLFPWELESFILKGKPSVSELTARRKFSCFIVTRRHKQIKIGKSARLFVKKLKLKENFSKLKEVVGQCAYAGQVKGRVRIIQTPADMVKMKAGDILVSQATSPDLLWAINKAGAIVTNTGGLICHAAIISRELKIPCVVGTAKATLVFQDGDLVEVNATKGTVAKI